MIGEDEIRWRVNKLIEKTAGASGVKAAAYWVGDKSEERRVQDDFKSGRQSWVAANRSAKGALQALAAGEVESAFEAWLIAMDFYVAALEARTSAADIEGLSKSANPRGRKSDAQVNKRLADACTEQELAGLTGKAARLAAIRSDPELREALADLSDAAIRARLNKGKKL
jgi:hypothetical protein